MVGRHLQVANCPSDLFPHRGQGEANELRKQLGVARSLRNGSSPEFDEKIARRKQLADMRNTLLERIRELKSGRAGLEVRTEEELDERVAEMEHAIQHDGLTLAVEKQYVRSIAKLRAQRDKVRELQGQSGDLQQLEAEAKKIKAVIDEVREQYQRLSFRLSPMACCCPRCVKHPCVREGVQSVTLSRCAWA